MQAESSTSKLQSLTWRINFNETQELLRRQRNVGQEYTTTWVSEAIRVSVTTPGHSRICANDVMFLLVNTCQLTFELSLRFHGATVVYVHADDVHSVVTYCVVT